MPLGFIYTAWEDEREKRPEEVHCRLGHGWRNQVMKWRRRRRRLEQTPGSSFPTKIIQLVLYYRVNATDIL